jgi:hypothetical protein
MSGVQIPSGPPQLLSESFSARYDLTQEDLARARTVFQSSSDEYHTALGEDVFFVFKPDFYLST